MIVVKTGNSKIFEEAYFVMRAEDEPASGDMLSEANRIIGNCEEQKRLRKKKRIPNWAKNTVLFFCGSAVGGVLAYILTVIF